jgi:hypothetical protein
LPIANSPGFSTRAVRISKIVEAVDQLLVGERLAAPQFERARRFAAARGRAPVKPRVDEPPEGHPVVRGRETQCDDRKRQRQGAQAHPAFPPELADTNRQTYGFQKSFGQLIVADLMRTL